MKIPIRGYFEIGIYHPKTPMNVGTLWRSAYQLGAHGIFTIGERFPEQVSDTVKVYRHIPYRKFTTFDEFHASLPHSCPVIAVEMGGKNLSSYHHPTRAIYLLGAEDHGIPASILSRCHEQIQLEAIRTASYNVAVAGSLVMYHRNFSGQYRGI